MTTRSPKAQNQFYLLYGLGHFPESFNFLWPQLWCINYSKNSGAPACQVFILSSVMGCLCSGPYHRFETRKCSFPCQVDRAEKEGKTRRSQSLQALYAGSWKPSGETWPDAVPDSACGYWETVSKGVLQGGSRASSRWEGVCHLPPWGRLLPAPLPYEAEAQP